MSESLGIESVLTGWPATIPRRGVVATKQSEQIVFADFSLGHGCALFQRTTPDAMGGREIILPFEQIATVKLTDSLSAKAREEMGFRTCSR